MNQLAAFTKKEFTEMIRTGKFWVMIIVFAILGIMNPAIAKLTPWMFEMLSDSMAEQGITVAKVEVTAMTSWQQFFKNIPMGVIVLVVMFCSILASEYQKGTLVSMCAMGLSRWKVIAAKSISSIFMWTICYWMSFLITYMYNDYFWDNTVAANLIPSAVCIYLAGIWLISLIFAFSSIFNTGSAVLFGTGGVFAVSYIIGMVPKAAEYLPTKLMSSQNLIIGAEKLSDYTHSVIITLLLIVLAYVIAIPMFNKKRL